MGLMFVLEGGSGGGFWVCVYSTRAWALSTWFQISYSFRNRQELDQLSEFGRKDGAASWVYNLGKWNEEPS